VEPEASDVLVPPILQPLPTAPSDRDDPRIETSAEVVGCASHGVTVTHVDALSHFRVDGRGYNDQPAAAESEESRGRADRDPLRDGVVTRGVLVDVAAMRERRWLEAGDRIEPEDMERWERAHDVRVTEGDALLVRTGWARRRAELGSYPERKHRPGLAAPMLPWLRERGVAMVASDAAHDAIPSGLSRMPMPVHTVGLVAMGLWLLDNGDFDRLAEACAARNRWSFLFMAAPPRFAGATGTPVNPIAIL
jgi:kynurenine formamidase